MSQKHLPASRGEKMVNILNMTNKSMLRFGQVKKSNLIHSKQSPNSKDSENSSDNPLEFVDKDP